MTIVFGSPEALEIVKRNRELEREHEERERAKAAFKGQPLKVWRVYGQATVVCTVAAPDEETAMSIADDFGDWNYEGDDPSGSVSANHEAREKPTQYQIRQAMRWVEGQGKH